MSERVKCWSCWARTVVPPACIVHSSSFTHSLVSRPNVRYIIVLAMMYAWFSVLPSPSLILSVWARMDWHGASRYNAQGKTTNEEYAFQSEHSIQTWTIGMSMLSSLIRGGGVGSSTTSWLEQDHPRLHACRNDFLPLQKKRRDIPTTLSSDRRTIKSRRVLSLLIRGVGGFTPLPPGPLPPSRVL